LFAPPGAIFLVRLQGIGLCGWDIGQRVALARISVYPQPVLGLIPGLRDDAVTVPMLMEIVASNC